MSVWKFKSCPRCQGDVYLDKDIDGWYEQCVQCGYVLDLRPIADVPDVTAEETAASEVKVRKTSRRR
ncbi:MAG: hypothetical protein PHU08_03075 [Dehalococcoidales bacterium]|nr:hypothetical protein [Dehalococcoidales bacterium]